MNQLPDLIRDERHLEDLLSAPNPIALEAISRIDGDILILGAAGKMGPSFTRMIQRASEIADRQRKVFAVSRFSNSKVEVQLREEGIETLKGDLLDETFLDRLPDVPNVVFMTGMKFGTSQDASMTWAMNVLLPALVCKRFKNSRIMAFSTGNVYPFVAPEENWSVETDALSPVGEYAMSALGRERMFQYGSLTYGIPTSMVRLNYAVEMRYGVVMDLASQVLNETPIDLSIGYANIIWQAEANAYALAAIPDASTPPYVVNVAGPELLDVRKTCEKFGHMLDKSPVFTGESQPTALLNDATKAYDAYGQTNVELERIIRWSADWIKKGGTSLGKPTHFQVRDGKF